MIESRDAARTTPQTGPARLLLQTSVIESSRSAYSPLPRHAYNFGNDPMTARGSDSDEEMSVSSFRKAERQWRSRISFVFSEP
jgi:hypothetical protein